MDKLLSAKMGHKEAMGDIVKNFTPYVVKTAKTIYVKNYELQDLIQIGGLSIIKAVKMFDVDKSNGFITYVTNAITKNFYHLIKSNIKEASCCSLNSVNAEGFEIIDNIASEENLEENIIKVEQEMALEKAIEELPKDKKEIIIWFYIENKSLELYAKQKGIAYRTAINRKKKALEKLRELLDHR